MPPKAPDLTLLIWAAIKPLVGLVVLIIIGTALYTAFIQYLKNRDLTLVGEIDQNPSRPSAIINASIKIFIRQSGKNLVYFVQA